MYSMCVLWREYDIQMWSVRSWDNQPQFCPTANLVSHIFDPGQSMIGQMCGDWVWASLHSERGLTTHRESKEV